MPARSVRRKASSSWATTVSIKRGVAREPRVGVRRASSTTTSASVGSDELGGAELVGSQHRAADDPAQHVAAPLVRRERPRRR